MVLIDAPSVYNGAFVVKPLRVRIDTQAIRVFEFCSRQLDENDINWLSKYMTVSHDLLCCSSLVDA